MSEYSHCPKCGASKIKKPGWWLPWETGVFILPIIAIRFNLVKCKQCGTVLNRSSGKSISKDELLKCRKYSIILTVIWLTSFLGTALGVIWLTYKIMPWYFTK